MVCRHSLLTVQEPCAIRLLRKQGLDRFPIKGSSARVVWPVASIPVATRSALLRTRSTDPIRSQLCSWPDGVVALA